MMVIDIKYGIRFLVMAFFLWTPIHAQFHSKYMHQDGLFMGTDVELVITEELSGTGTFDVENIEIKVKKFAFTGTIKCSGLCIITADKPFDPTMFRREGNGTFIIHQPATVVKNIVDQNITDNFPSSKKSEWAVAFN